MKIHSALLLLISSIFLISCLDSPSDDQSADDDGDSKPSASASSDVEETSEAEVEVEEKMSFPEALKIKRSLGRELEALERDFEKRDELAAEELEAMKVLEPVREYRTALEGTHEELTRSLAFWKKATRDSFKGVKLPEIVTVSGDKFQEVEITGVSDHQLEIVHSGGSSTLEISDLSVGLRKNLIHEPTVKAEINN